MAATIRGVNVIWGLETSVVAGTGFETTGADHEPTADEKKIKDKVGISKTHVTYDPGDKLTLEVYPAGTTPGACPTPGSLVLVNSVTYIAMVGTKEVWANESEKRMTFVLQKWDGLPL